MLSANLSIFTNIVLTILLDLDRECGDKGKRDNNSIWYNLFNWGWAWRKTGLERASSPVFRKGETPIVFVVFSITIGEEPNERPCFRPAKDLDQF